MATAAEQQLEYEAKAARIGELAAHINAANAELARLAADFDDRGLYVGYGIRTCGHWLTINTGLGQNAADEILRVGHALASLPRLREAFECGQLSLDKVRLVTRVAGAEDEDVWLYMATYASGAQLSRIVCGYERSGDDDATVHERRARRGLWTVWRGDGLFELRAVLAPEDGVVVIAALDAVAARLGTPSETPGEVFSRGGSLDEASAAGLDPAMELRPARRVDALTEVCEALVGGGADALVAHGPVDRLVVHVDLDVLTGESTKGRCQVEGGSGLAPSVARRIGCDADVMAMIERDGEPINLGRKQRLVDRRLKAALRARDRGCRFPGCRVPEKFIHAHHVEHWAALGPTDMGNLLALCGFHHRRHHDGAFDVVLNADRRPVFLRPGGQPFAEPQGPPLVPLTRAGMRRLLRGKADAITGETPVALDRGARFDLGLTVELLHMETKKRRRQPEGASPGADP